MTDDQREIRASGLPARWRITGWIVLTTLIALVSVTFTARSIGMIDIEKSAGATITREAEAFSRFAREGTDTRASEELGSPAAMLRSYLTQQSLSSSETYYAITGEQVVAVEGRQDRGVEETLPETPFSVDVLPPALGEAVTGPARSGVAAETESDPVHWGRVDVRFGSETGSLLITHSTAADHRRLDSSTIRMAWVALGGLIMTSGIAWLVAGQILKPVRQVRQVAQSISERDLTTRVPVHGTDDMAAVAETFNAMLDRLESAQLTQQRFVDDAGHELRTPITVVRGNLELLSEDPEERQQTLRLVDSELARMGRIVSDLLMLARAEQFDFAHPVRTDLVPLMLDVEAKVQMLGARRWQLVQIAEGCAVVDSQRVTQAFLQLAANAVQHTRDGDAVQLGSTYVRTGASTIIRFWLEDQGPGIDAEDAERIFGRFERGPTVPDPSSTERPGAGLGLAIVHAIAEAHHGSAWVVSAPGRGATFGLDLPGGLETPTDPSSTEGAEDAHPPR